MGATLIHRIEIHVEDPAGAGTGWDFDLRVPPTSVCEQLDELLRPLEEARRKAAAAVFASPDVRRAIAEAGDQAGESAAVRAALIEHGPSMLEEMQGGNAPLQVQRELAALVEPYCSQPRGLTDDNGQALTWQAIREVNEPYAVSVLYGAAVQAHSEAMGARARVERKNSSSSSPS
jgi:hypothetical protein